MEMDFSCELCVFGWKEGVGFKVLGHLGDLCHDVDIPAGCAKLRGELNTGNKQVLGHLLTITMRITSVSDLKSSDDDLCPRGAVGRTPHLHGRFHCP
jgi:hypothetical protein